MSYIDGRKYTCDRCGKETFCQCIGEGETDGGYTRWNKFELLPVGWDSHADTGLLCSGCNAYYKRMIADFMSKKSQEAQ